MGLQAVIDWFLPKEDHFFTFLERQATLACEGAKALSRFRDPNVSAEEVRAATAERSGLRRELEQLLTVHRGNVSAVAREMGKARVQIRRLCKRYEIDPDTFR